MLLVLVTLSIVLASVLLHYLCLLGLSLTLPALRIAGPLKILAGVVGAILAHVVEVGLFAVAYYHMSGTLGWGELQGAYNGTFADSLYFSFATYTTLGYGDINPVGPIRYLTGLEALTGFVLITWTASYLYMEMRRYWDR